MKRPMVHLVGTFLLVAASGCATSPGPLPPGPRVQPDPGEWRRKSVPLPPLYMELTSGTGKRWKMVTPLYWQAIGPESVRRQLFPLASFASEQAAGNRRGHVLTWFWGRSPEKRHDVVFPFYWDFRGPAARSTVLGPLYTRKVEGPDWRRRTVLMPWLYSRESDASGYDYRGVLFRLVGYEKQMFEGERRERLWLFFVFHINTVS